MRCDTQEINTVNCTATVQIDLGIFWTDLRLIGYDHQVLPDKLWSPRLEMLRAEVKETQLAFMRLETGRYFNAGDYLCTAAKRFNTHHRNGKLRYWPTPGTATDPRPWPESGRMMKSVRYDAVVDNPMSSLDDFPFDLDKIELNWITTSSWETRDLSMKGVRVTQTAWNLRYIQKYGNLGQITKLQRLYQAKYQAETIKAALEKDFEGTSFSLSTKGVKADDEEAPRDGEIADDDLDKILEGAYFNKKNFPKTKFDIHGHYQGIDIGENSDIPPIDGNHPSLGVLFDQLRDYRKPGQVVLKNGTCAQEGDGTYEEADVLLAGDPEGGPKYWIYQDGTREKAIDPETRRTAGGPQYKNNGWRAEKAAAKIKREKIGRIARMLAVLEAQREKAKNNSSDEVDDDDANDEDATDSSAWAQGRIISRACDGDLDEWECLGASYQITRHPQLTHSPQRQELNLFIHMKRKSGYYIFKVLIPLYLIQFLMYTTMYMDTDDISGRLGFTVTGFLAAFAMLYIVGQDLPKLDQTTSIDRIINLTTVTIVGLAVGSCRVYHTHKKMCNVPEPKFDLVNLSGIGEAHAFYQQLWSSADDPCEDAIFEDKFITGMLVLVNVIGSIYFFAGPLWHQRTYTHQIKKEEQNYSGKTKKLTNEEKMRRAYRKKNGGRGFPEMEAEGEEDEMTKADEDVEVEEDLRLTDKTIATMSTSARRKHLRKLKDSVNKAKNMRLMLQFFIDEEDKPDAFVDLPTVNKFCDYVPWHSVETYQDYLRRRLNGKRVSGGVTSEVRHSVCFDLGSHANDLNTCVWPLLPRSAGHSFSLVAVIEPEADCPRRPSCATLCRLCERNEYRRAAVLMSLTMNTFCTD
jgi:hypothetical protein